MSTSQDLMTVRNALEGDKYGTNKHDMVCRRSGFCKEPFQTQSGKSINSMVVTSQCSSLSDFVVHLC